MGIKEVTIVPWNTSVVVVSRPTSSVPEYHDESVYDIEEDMFEDEELVEVCSRETAEHVHEATVCASCFPGYVEPSSEHTTLMPNLVFKQ